MSSVDISLVVPVYNEAAGLAHFHAALLEVLAKLPETFEIIYVDDGSVDETPGIVRGLSAQDDRVVLVSLSRNFGKESALSAGIEYAQGKAVIMLDGDGQHPVNLIPQFIKAWEDGAQVVIGVRTTKVGESWVKRVGSHLFYGWLNKISQRGIIPGSTDYRLIDSEVQQAFLTFSENDRITRGLIDWLGFNRHLIRFKANTRQHGHATYSLQKLVRLAINGFTSLSSTPLYFFGYVGAFITIGAFILGVSVGIEQLLMGDPWHWHFTGTALLGTLILFLVGIVLLSQWILSLYVAGIYNQSKARPLFVVNKAASARLSNKR